MVCRRYAIALVLVLTLSAGCSLALEAAGPDRPTIAIVDITNVSNVALPGIGQYAAEFLSTYLSSTGQFHVVERQKLQSLLTEQGFKLSGLADNSQIAAQAGRLLGASLIVTGSILEVNQRVVEFQGYGVQSRQNVLEVLLGLRVINTTTGEVDYGDILSLSCTDLDLGGSLKVQDSGKVQRLARDLMTLAASRIVEHYKAKGNLTESTRTFVVPFQTTPSGADVLVDGVYVGSTPIEVPLDEGVHTVILRLAGYEPWESQIRVYGGLKVAVTLLKKDGQK